MALESTPVVLRNVKFNRALILSMDQPGQIFSTLLTGSGRFELKSGADVLVSGTIEKLENRVPGTETSSVGYTYTCVDGGSLPASSRWLPLSGEDFYKEMRLRDINHSGLFRGLQRVDNKGITASFPFPFQQFEGRLLSLCVYRYYFRLATVRTPIAIIKRDARLDIL